MAGKAADLGHHLHQGLHVLQDRALQLQDTKGCVSHQHPFSRTAGVTPASVL